jgi:hypothetical protein
MLSHASLTTASSNMDNFHNLNDKWCLWAHLPHNTDWSMTSYIKIATFTTIENAISVTETLPNVLIENCMLFIMKEGIRPMWEDPKNRNGGCFSYKVLNKNAAKVWKDLTYVVIGQTVSENSDFVNCVNGITISPKKNFCIIKIWMANCKHQNPASVSSDIKGIIPQGCLFKKHTPEF